VRFVFTHPRTIPVIKVRRGKNRTLFKLRAFLNTEEAKTVKWLTSLWDKQASAITYKELREAVLAGSLSPERLEKWQKDYSNLVNTALAPQWQKAMGEAAEEIKQKYPYFLYNPATEAAQEYIKQRGAQLVTGLVQSQREALNAMIARGAYYNAMTAGELARIMRPCIGLTKPQAAANLNHYNAVKENLLKNNPNMKEETAEKKAREQAAYYAQKQHSYRAQTIANTELAAAYNQGHYGATKDAQAKGYIGDCKKVWLTADDETVCPICGKVEGEERNMDDMFSINVLLPPAHPGCRCAVAYEEITEPVVPPVIETVTEPDTTGELPNIDTMINQDDNALKPTLSSGKIGDTDGYTKIIDVRRVDFSDDKKIQEQIEAFSDKYAYAKVEYAMVMSLAGKAYELEGLSGVVNPGLVGREALKGSIVIHNHPVRFEDTDRDDSFSLMDLIFAAEYKTGKQYLTSGKRRNAFEFTKKMTSAEISEAWKKAEDRILMQALNQEIKIEWRQEEILREIKSMIEGFKFYEEF
jgi:SPP1 gp7 family putative phage head morphogenesis protein